MGRRGLALAGDKQGCSLSGAEFLFWEQRGLTAGEHLGKSGASGGLIGGGVLLERAPVLFRARRRAEESSARHSSAHLGMAGALGGHKARPGRQRGPGASQGRPRASCSG